jgi:hypothetical protein
MQVSVSGSSGSSRRFSGFSKRLFFEFKRERGNDGGVISQKQTAIVNQIELRINS